MCCSTGRWFIPVHAQPRFLAIARNFGRSLRIPDASLQTSVNFPRTRPLKCMEQTAFLFNLNQERTEMKNSFKITVKHIISYALFMK